MTTVVVKGSDESRDNNTVAADSALVVPLSTGVYRIRGIFPWTAHATPDIRIGARISGSTYAWAAGAIRSSDPGNTIAYRLIGYLGDNNLVTTAARRINGWSGYPTSFAKAALDIMLRVEGEGEFQFVWAQNTTDASNPSIVRADARFVYERVEDLNYLSYAVRESDHILYANSDFADVPDLSIALEPNTGYAIEACIIATSYSWGRRYEAKFGFDGDLGAAHMRTDASQGDGSPTVWPGSTTFGRLIEPENIAIASALEYSGSGVVSSTNRGVQYHQGYLFTGEAGGTLKVQSRRTGNNPGGTARMMKGSWISAEKLPPC